MKETWRYILGYTLGFLVFLVLIPFGFYALARLDHLLWNVRLFDRAAVRLVISLPIFILGLVFMIWSNWALYRIGKGGPTDVFGLSVSPQTHKLVIVGLYRYSRNPMVFGALSIYLSLGVFLNSTLCLVFLLMTLPFVILYLKSTEEKRLLKDFGQAFVDYQQKVPLIFPLIKRKIGGALGTANRALPRLRFRRRSLVRFIRKKAILDAMLVLSVS